MTTDATYTARYPVAVSVSIADDSDNELIVALCNDGTIWQQVWSGSTPGWTQLPAIPQPTPQEAA